MQKEFEMKEYRVLLVVLMLFSVAFFGFSGGKSEEPADAGAKEPVTLSYMRVGLGPVTMVEVEAMLAPFQEMYPWISVDTLIVAPPQLAVKLQTAIAGGAPPDLVKGLSAGEVVKYTAAGGILMDMAPYAEKDGFDWQSYYSPEAINLFNKEPDTLYAINDGMNTTAIAYNKDMFDAAGVAYPTDDWTWDDVLAAARKLTLDTDGDGVTDQWGIGTWKAGFYSWVWAAGSSFFTSDLSEVQVDSIVIDTLQWIADLRFKHKVAPPEEIRDSFPRLSFMFSQGKIAMYPADWMPDVAFLFQKMGFNWDVAMMPLHPETGERAAQRGAAAVVGFAATEHPEETYLLWKWMTGDEGIHARTMGSTGTPMMPNGPADKWPMLTEAFLQVETPANSHVYVDMLPLTGFFELPLPNRSEIYTALNPLIEPLWLGEKTAAEVLPLIKAGLDPLLKQ